MQRPSYWFNALSPTAPSNTDYFSFDNENAYNNHIGAMDDCMESAGAGAGAGGIRKDVSGGSCTGEAMDVTKLEKEISVFDLKPKKEVGETISLLAFFLFSVC